MVVKTASGSGLRVDREIRILEQDEAIKALGTTPAETVKMVAFESNNKMTNTGEKAWEKKSGLLSIWILGNYDAINKVLTIVQYNKPDDAINYVSSMWELQKEPYRGNVVNSYNDDPAESGVKTLGSFYELETSSPAVALKPGETISHIHRTYHLKGPEVDLDPIAKETLGVTIAEIKSALSKSNI